MAFAFKHYDCSISLHPIRHKSSSNKACFYPLLRMFKTTILKVTASSLLVSFGFAIFVSWNPKVFCTQNTFLYSDPHHTTRTHSLSRSQVQASNSLLFHCLNADHNGNKVANVKKNKEDWFHFRFCPSYSSDRSNISSSK